MSFTRLVFLLSCAAIFVWTAAKADAPGIHLVRQSGTDQINPIDDQLHRGMKWSHGGYFVIDKLAGLPPVIYSLDREGTWTTTAQFRNPEPTRFHTFNFDRQSDGTIVFSGLTESAPRVVSPFLAWTSADGKVQRMVRTDPYFPHQVAVAPDDTIWTLGIEMVNLDDRDPAVNKEARVLRHFDRTGKMIWSAFPQSQFNRYQRFRLADGLLVVTRDRLGWYGPRQGKTLYTEMSLGTMEMKEYPGGPGDPSKREVAEALAITDDGEIAISIEDRSPGVRTNYVFDRAASHWVPVSVLPMGGFPFTPALIGSDENNFVFKYGREAGFFSVSR